MKRGKRSNEKTQLDQFFDDPDEFQNYTFHDEDAERRIAKLERNLETDDFGDVGWGFFKSY